MKWLILISVFLGISAFLWPVDSTYPAKNPPETVEELGKLLFFDKILSSDYTISCASCHRPEFAFADTTALSRGVGGALGKRNTPSVMNMAARPYFFYDGRAASLEGQIKEPIENPVEMNLPFHVAVQRIRTHPEYPRYFQGIYGRQPDSVTILHAMATYIRSLESNGSAPNDRWLFGEENAMTASQIRGREIFMGKGKCFDCHFSPDFTGDEFRNIGLYNRKEFNDRGRFDITKDSADLGKFKVPGLRNVALTAPYMHNGQFKTLEEVIEYYDNPLRFVHTPLNLDTLLAQPLDLSQQEKTDLLNFLHALTDKNLPKGL